MKEKTCQKCRIESPVSAFYKNARNKDNYSQWCKACVNGYSKTYRAKVSPTAACKKARIVEYSAPAVPVVPVKPATLAPKIGSTIANEYKTCTKCESLKPIEEYHKDKKGKLGRASQCKECKNKSKKG